MPIYEYECEECGEKFEALVRGDEKPQCPKCACSRLKKLITSATYRIKCASCSGGVCSRE